MNIGLEHFLIISAILFSLGMYAVVRRKNAILVLMGLELILNSANINFVAFSKFGGMNIEGHVATVFVIIRRISATSVFDNPTAVANSYSPSMIPILYV